MNFTVVSEPQLSPEWRRARCGRLTASRAGDMLARIKKGEAAARRNLRTQLVCERLTGMPQDDTFVSREMQRGLDREPDARVRYEALTGSLVRRTGFLSHTELMAGCSLDGDVGNFRGIVEIKCPMSATHIGYLRGRVVPYDYRPQVIHQLWMTGAAWCDFVSFDDRFPPALQLFVVRVERNEADNAAYELMVRQFLSEVARECDEVAGMTSGCALAAAPLSLPAPTDVSLVDGELVDA